MNNTPSPPNRAVQIARDLERWQPPDGAQELLRDDFLELLERRGTVCLDRERDPQHLTASCFVFTPDFSQLLLCFHRKGQFWVQFGGHIEIGDASVSQAALREAVEEGGIADLHPLTRLPLDLDRHSLGDGFGRCTVHWDIGYAATVRADCSPTTSAESEDVRWWPIDALPSPVPHLFEQRVRRILGGIGAY